MSRGSCNSNISIAPQGRELVTRGAGDGRSVVCANRMLKWEVWLQSRFESREWVN